MAQHHPHTVALDEPPVTRLPPLNLKAEHLVVIRRTPLEVGDGENEGPGGNLGCHDKRPRAELGVTDDDDV